MILASLLDESRRQQDDYVHGRYELAAGAARRRDLRDDRPDADRPRSSSAAQRGGAAGHRRGSATPHRRPTDRGSRVSFVGIPVAVPTDALRIEKGGPREPVVRTAAQPRRPPARHRLDRLARRRRHLQRRDGGGGAARRAAGARPPWRRWRSRTWCPASSSGCTAVCWPTGSAGGRSSRPATWCGSSSSPSSACCCSRAIRRCGLLIVPASRRSARPPVRPTRRSARSCPTWCARTSSSRANGLMGSVSPLAAMVVGPVLGGVLAAGRTPARRCSSTRPPSASRRCACCCCARRVGHAPDAARPVPWAHFREGVSFVRRTPWLARQPVVRPRHHVRRLRDHADAARCSSPAATARRRQLRLPASPSAVCAATLAAVVVGIAAPAASAAGGVVHDVRRRARRRGRARDWRRTSVVGGGLHGRVLRRRDGRQPGPGQRPRLPGAARAARSGVLARLGGRDGQRHRCRWSIAAAGSSVTSASGRRSSPPVAAAVVGLAGRAAPAAALRRAAAGESRPTTSPSPPRPTPQLTTFGTLRQSPQQACMPC